jgi:hypothetical protein
MFVITENMMRRPVYLSVLIIGIVSDKICGENKKKFSNFFSENRAVYEIMWENIVEQGRTHCMMDD